MKPGAFGVHFRNIGFGKKGSLCKEGEKAKHRFTITLVANAAGGKESAIVIWKAKSLGVLKVLTCPSYQCIISSWPMPG